METQKEAPKSKGVVSVKLNDAEKSALAQQAESEGITISQLLRKKLKEESKQGQGPATTETSGAAVLSTESLLNIDSLIDEKLAAIDEKLGAIDEKVRMTNETNPVKDYLKKLAGETPENPATFTDDEDEAFKEVIEAMRAETIGNLLLEQNSVPITPLFINEIQRRTFKEMMEKRNEVISEKLLSFTQLFQKAIAQAFADDCRRLYDRNLFKATYGFNYEECRAVFFEE